MGSLALESRGFYTVQKESEMRIKKFLNKVWIETEEDSGDFECEQHQSYLLCFSNTIDADLRESEYFVSLRYGELKILASASGKSEKAALKSLASLCKRFSQFVNYKV